MHLEQAAAIERELVTRSMALHPAQYRRHAGIFSPSGVVVSGFCGHLYIADGGNQWERQLLGQSLLTESAIAQWSSILASHLSGAQQHGVNLAHLVVPEKQLALPHYRWKTDLEPDLSIRPLQQILQAAPPGIEILYPLTLFENHKPWCELFYRGNSHWCATGCLIAARAALLALTGANTPAIENIPLEQACIKHDLSLHFPDDDPFEEVIRIRPSGTRIFDNKAFEKTGHYTNSHYITRNPDAPIHETLIIFGDSYACDLGLTAAMSACFLHVHFVWSKTIAWPYVKQMQARFVLWESAERFLFKPPNFD